MYNSLLGVSPADASSAAEAEYDQAELNTETCAICCSEIVLGPLEAVSRMDLPQGEAPRHFECGHALHSDCFAVYVCTASSGHTCPICALDHTSTAAAGGKEEEETYAYGEAEEVEVARMYDALAAARRSAPLPAATSHSRVERLRSFSEVNILDALAIATRRPDDSSEQTEEELELQAALQMSIAPRPE